MIVEQTADEIFMRQALMEASKALERGEVPIGAVVVHKGVVVGRGYNMVETLNDPTAHAEMQAITSATNSISGKYLTGATLYVTIEPCVMCAGALAWAQIGRVVYGATDPKRGYSTISNAILHPKTEVKGGVLKEECGAMVEEFFRTLRR